MNDDDWGCGGVEAGAGSGWFGWGLGVSGSVCGGLDSRVAGRSAIVEIWGNQTNKLKSKKERSIRERLVWFNMFFVLVFALDWALIFPCPRECDEGCNTLCMPCLGED